MDILNLNLQEKTQAIKNKKISARELAEFYLTRAQALNSKLNAVITFNEKLLQEASALDQIPAESQGPLHGIPIGFKDNYCTLGIKTTAASKILSNFISPYDSTVAKKIKSAGGLVFAKLNMDEFAMGSSNESSAFGKAFNPWNPAYVPGGSSGGSAAAQAAKLCGASLGTDTGGSIRQPAHFCGLVGVKPTYGRISRYGIIAYASSLDQAGPMTNSVADAALMLEVLCGHDANDMTSSPKPVPRFTQSLDKSIAGLKFGFQKGFFEEELHPDVNQAYLETFRKLEKLGAIPVEVDLSINKNAVPVYYLVATSEASSNLSRYDGVRFGHRHNFENLATTSLHDFYSLTRAEGFGAEVKRRILLGTFCLSSGFYDAYYDKACRVRRLIQNQYLAEFKKCDFILSPVATTPAFKVGAKNSDPLKMYLNDIFTVATNLAGLPGMSLPVKLSKDGLPVGVQITGQHFQEETMLAVAAQLEKEFEFSKEVPHVY